VTRSTTAELLAQVTSHAVRYALFVELLFDSAPLRVHQSLGTLSATETGGSARTWYGVGELGSVGSVQENSNLQTQELELTLSGLDSTLLAVAMNEAVSGRVAKIFIGAFNEQDQLSGNLTFLWRGRIDRMRTTFGTDNNTVTVVCESEAASLTRSKAGYFTDNMQQRRFAGDKFFEYVAQLPFMTIIWAGKGVTNRNTFSPTPKYFGHLG